MAITQSIRVKIVGAGSIGNHLCYAARNLHWEVTVVDIDQLALDRMKYEIYPKRYGAWDDNIKLSLESELSNSKNLFDVVFVCTPPNTHLQVALDQVRKLEPKIVFIEKPLSSPEKSDLLNNLESLCKEIKTKILVGYNYRLTDNTIFLAKVIQNHDFGQIKFIRSNFRENWDGIMNAHPWLRGPDDSYLGFIELGGGSLFEHSHGLDLFLYVTKLLKISDIKIKSVNFAVKNEGRSIYDENVVINFKSGQKILGTVEQNVFTYPPEKILEIEFERAKIIWFTSENESGAKVINYKGQLIDELLYPKQRKDDFYPEMNHVKDVIENNLIDSPISIENVKPTQIMLDTIYFEHFKIND